jgi:hypothetical protein
MRNHLEGGRGKRKGLRGKRMEVWRIYTHEDCHETHQTLLESEGKRKRENENIMEGVNLFKVHCMHV